jgi:hypothetical protein
LKQLGRCTVDDAHDISLRSPHKASNADSSCGLVTVCRRSHFSPASVVRPFGQYVATCAINAHLTDLKVGFRRRIVDQHQQQRATRKPS